MAEEIEIYCPLCEIPMSYEIITSKRTNNNGKQVQLVCPKCGSDIKTALQKKLEED